MNTEFGGNTEVCGPIMSNMKSLGKRTLEWDLNDWKWDGDLLLATPINPPPSNCRSRQLFPLIPEHSVITNVSNSSSYGSEFMNTTNEIETRRGFNPDLDLNNEVGSLNLKLGERAYGVVEGEDDKMEGKSVKKSKPNGPNGPVGPVCQVEGCRADLKMGKDYHRRHRVCEVHSKVSEALVGNIVQRFCQQCSRFHPLERFDEGKRSCRQRLAGHNKRRRKTQPETPSTNPSSLPDEKNAAFLLVSLLKLLSGNNSDNSKDQDQISHLLRSLGGQVDGINIPDLQRASHSLGNGGSSVGTPKKNLSRIQEPFQAAPLMRENQYETQRTLTMLQEGRMRKADRERDRLSGIDLNSVYIDSEECVDISDGSYVHTPDQYLLKSSPPQTSGTSDSISGHYSSSGSGSGSGSETRGFTDRIVFKLFGKDPNDLPHLLRAQLVDWLSKTPTDIEGYIRPGCIVLTIYLRLNKALWEELCFDLTSSLTRLLNVSDDSVWKTGWIYTRVQQRAAFICDGQVVLDRPLPVISHQSRISSISPIAVPSAQTVQIVVKGSNLFGTTSRVLCAIEGKYLVQESCAIEENTNRDDEDDIQCISFCCSTPDVVGRGFIEVEDQGLSGCFFPFIVAEPDICSEVCMLEKLIDVDETDEGVDGEYNSINLKNNSLDFIHELGWLLRWDRLSKWGPSGLNLDRFSFDRLKWLIEFSMDRYWCAVLKKLLDSLFSGTIDIGVHASLEHALSEMALLHTAVQRNSRPLVEFLLRYRPIMAQHKLGQEKQSDDGLLSGFIFRPDVAGSNGLTPLHVAASCEGFENVLDALLEDPGMVGMKAWENAQDSTGLTPKDYALLRGHNNYITLFQKKMDKNSSGEHVVVDILAFSNLESKQKQVAKFNNVFYTEKSQPSSCNMCVRKAGYGFRGTGLACKPAMLSLVAIAVVCVCTALLFKSMPRVCYVFGPFRWELLKYGAV